MQLEASPLNSQFSLSQWSILQCIPPDRDCRKIVIHHYRVSLITLTHFRFSLGLLLSRKVWLWYNIWQTRQTQEQSPLKEGKKKKRKKNTVLHVSENNINATILDTLTLTFVLFNSDVQLPSHPEMRTSSWTILKLLVKQFSYVGLKNVTSWYNA